MENILIRFFSGYMNLDNVFSLISSNLQQSQYMHFLSNFILIRETHLIYG
jgi:hypothetical protein